MSIDGTKIELRRRFLAIRKGLGEEVRSAADAAIEWGILGLPEWDEAEVLLAYLDFGPEVRTRGIIQAAWDAGKAVALPWCVPGTREMCWFGVTSFEGLVKSAFGMEEPDPEVAPEMALDTGRRMMALVPGLAFDRQGYRLGYGGGFYDTFLARFGGASVGLCREAQLTDSLPDLGVIDVHDQAAQIVVTDVRTIRTP